MATATSRKLFVNLAVKDLGRAVDFFTQLGFSFDPTFTDDQATCMILSEDAYVMLLVEERFKDFTTKELADPGAETEAILAISAESREAVDELVQKALAAGGPAVEGPDGLRLHVHRAASRILTVTSGKSSGWTPARSRSKRPRLTEQAAASAPKRRHFADRPERRLTTRLSRLPNDGPVTDRRGSPWRGCSPGAARQ